MAAGSVRAKRSKGPTERRAAKAARQLAYHREKVRWMEERMAENAAVLEAYLTLLDENAVTFSGGCQVSLDAGGVEVRDVAIEAECEQLELIPGYIGEAEW